MISENIKSKLAGGSAIRKMFEEGNRLKSIYGEDKVFDFSIGNPDLEPPHEVAEALVDLAVNPVPGMHGYMSNSGYESTRSIIAKKRSDESGVAVTADAICMTVGAAAAMNDVLHSLLDPGDEVIVLAPYFMEYKAFTEANGSRFVLVPADLEKFQVNMTALAEAVNENTQAVILNS